jgi:hypothetical protein
MLWEWIQYLETFQIFNKSNIIHLILSLERKIIIKLIKIL